MTDSEDDLLESYQYSIRNEGTIIHAKGPNINFETISLPSSTMQILPSNDNRPKHGRINYDHRSLLYRRETSPMSAYNVSHFSRPYYRRLSARSHIGSQQSVYNRGNRSPVSTRSFDSTASVTASDIVVALKNEHFNKYDQKLLKAACYKFLKNKSRKRLEYMRNRRILMSKVRRQRSTEDLGEMASESSSSSENSISPKTFKPKDTNKVIRTNNVNQVFIENNYRNVLTSNHNQIVNDEDILQTTAAVNKLQECTNNNKENPCLLKDRFTKGFLLPAQRFSKSTNGPSLTEDNLSGNLNKNQVPDLIRSYARDLTGHIGSDDEIFSSTTNDKAPEKSITETRKRSIDSVGTDSNPKAPKLMKTDTTKETENLDSVKNNIKNDFNFARPLMPITKLGKFKKRKIQPEILISKSSQPVSLIEETVENLSPISKQPQVTTKHSEDINDLDKRSSIGNESVNTINDISKRPSFIKRKLFTQKLDVFEAKIDNNTSQGSPRVNKYVSGKEKTKPRKLASSQSCLSRDVLTEDHNNLLNLLHKIVPADQMSLMKPNKTDTVNRNSDGAQWDIDSILSACNPDDGSETYTDDDILGSEEQSNVKSDTKPQHNVTSKEVDETPKTYDLTNEQSERNGLKDRNKNVTKINQKSFWDTDIESDWENNVFLPYKLNNSRSKTSANQRVNKTNCETNKNIAVSTTKHLNTKVQKVDANKNVNNCQKSIWDTDFESDLETYGILPPRSRICKEKNVVNNRNANNTENCENNKIIPVNCKTKTIITSTKCQKVDGNKTSTNNYQKSIWDTDFESDLENSGILPLAKILASAKTNTTNDKISNQETCQNKKNGEVDPKTKSVINSKSQNVDLNKKTAKNCRKSIWENYGILGNRSGTCKTNSTTAVSDENGSNKENCKNNASIAVNSATKSVVIKCQRLDDMIKSNRCQKSVSQAVEPETCKNNATAQKRVNKDDDTVKADFTASIKTRREATKRTPNKVVNGKGKNTKEVQKNNSPESDHNLSERWLRANRRAKVLNQSKAKDSLRTVSTLVSHRMTRQMTKKLHNSDLTTTSKQSNESTELNISNRSLRPRKKTVYQRKI